MSEVSNYSLKVKNISFKFTGLIIDKNYYFYTYSKILLKVDLLAFCKFVNDYYSDLKNKNFYIDKMDVIDIFNQMIDIDSYKNAKYLFEYFVCLKKNKEANNFFLRYLEKIIRIYIEYEDQQFITNQYLIFCYFYLYNVDELKINFIPYVINEKKNYIDFNNYVDFELDN